MPPGEIMFECTWMLRTGLQNEKRKTQHAPQFKMLAPLQRQLRLGLAIRAFQPQHHLLGRLCFLVEDGFRLTPVAGLFAVVAALALGEEGGLWVCERLACGVDG